MKFLFSHREFPAHFEHLIIELAKDHKNEIVFITEAKNNFQIKGVRKIEYKLKRQPTKNCHNYLKNYEEAIIHGQAAAESAITLKDKVLFQMLSMLTRAVTLCFLKMFFLMFHWLYFVNGIIIQKIQMLILAEKY